MAASSELFAPDLGLKRQYKRHRLFERCMNLARHRLELGNERDPIIGTQDGTFDMTIPKRPIRKKIKGLPAFTTVRGGAYFFMPGLKALRWLTELTP